MRMKFIPRSGVIIIYTAAYQFNIGRTRLRRQMPIRRAERLFARFGGTADKKHDTAYKTNPNQRTDGKRRLHPRKER